MVSFSPNVFLFTGRFFPENVFRPCKPGEPAKKGSFPKFHYCFQSAAREDRDWHKSSAAEGVENPNPQRLAVYYRRF